MEKEKFAEKWKAVENMLAKRFNKKPDLEAILFLIGIQELGKIKKKFNKEQKEDLMHIAVCSLLGQAGYYKLSHHDKDGWPHFVKEKDFPEMKMEEQENLLKEQIIIYFEKHELV